MQRNTYKMFWCSCVRERRRNKQEGQAQQKSGEVREGKHNDCSNDSSRRVGGQRANREGGLANELEVEDDGDEDEKDEDYGSSDDALLVHSRDIN